ncbi:hypothetical protein GCM10023171_29630 [Microbacterium panaciterrae]|uniref:Uncharacterized protein n=1 Tax=Microbacterium panaciterrae TaxID=985759 RepID=A0ABP8PM61_9MICO
MDLNYAMSYRITTLEIEQAAIRAERARMAAEHGEQIVRRDGLLRRVLRGIAARGAARRSAGTARVARRAARATRPTALPAETGSPPARCAIWRQRSRRGHRLPRRAAPTSSSAARHTRRDRIRCAGHPDCRGHPHRGRHPHCREQCARHRGAECRCRVAR